MDTYDAEDRSLAGRPAVSEYNEVGRSGTAVSDSVDLHGNNTTVSDREHLDRRRRVVADSIGLEIGNSTLVAQLAVCTAVLDRLVFRDSGKAAVPDIRDRLAWLEAYQWVPGLKR